jgi:hypothetical protein
MNNTSNIDADEVEIIHIMSKLLEFAWFKTSEIQKIRHEITHSISQILSEYFWKTQA